MRQSAVRPVCCSLLLLSTLPGSGAASFASRRGRCLRGKPGLTSFSSAAKRTYDFDVLLPRDFDPGANDPRLSSADSNAGERMYEPERSRIFVLCWLTLSGCLRTSRVISAHILFARIQGTISPLAGLSDPLLSATLSCILP